MAAIEDPQEYALRVGEKASSLRFYGLVTATIRRILFPYFKVEVQGNVENLKAQGALILAPVNMRSIAPATSVARARSRSNPIVSGAIRFFE